MIDDNKIVTNVRDVGSNFECIAPKTKEHLAVYCATVLGIRFPSPASDEEYCVKNNHKSPLDALWAAYAEIDDFSIWYAMRGSGKTFDLSGLGFLESTFKHGCGITILGGSLEQSMKAVSYLKSLWDLPGMPRHLLINSEIGGRGYKLNNGSWIEALAASPKSVRGPHPQKLRLDEVDEMAKVIYDAAFGQPKANRGIKDNIIVSSTLHHASGLMTDIIDTRDKTGAVLYPWCIHEVTEPRGFWTIEEIERKRKQITKEMWDSEYLLKRPKVGDTIFDFESVDRAWQRGFNITYEKKNDLEAGVDWGHTCTVLHIIEDLKEYINIPESKSWEYWELTERCEEIIKICIDKRISTLYCDSNPKDGHITLRKIMKKRRCSTTVVPVVFGQWKEFGINVIRFLLEKDLINIKDKTCQDKLKKYHYSNTQTEQIAKEDDHYPDALIAWAASRYKILG
jgi:hypothetical protein